LLNQKKKAKLQSSQNSSQTNGDNNKTVSREAVWEHLKETINEL